MASFSFGAGNARKLAAIPLYAAGRLATAVIPRSRDEWVFGCAAGIADGALALWRVREREGRSAVWLVGSESERADAAALGIPAVPKSSVAGWWRTARARVIVITHGFGDVNRYAVAGGFIVQLWHGIPLKRIGLDSPETLRLPSAVRRVLGRRLSDAVIARMYRSATRRISLVPAASHLVRGRLESAFGLPDERVPVTGEPRVDVLSTGDAATRRTRARALIADVAGPVSDAAALVLYAPTWRDGAVDPAIPDAVQWRRLVEVLDAENAILLVRSHPLGAGEYAPPFPTDRVRGLPSTLAPDVTPMLPGADVLVTDYSSLVFDSALVPLPVVYFAPDEEDYTRRRGFYGAYRDVAFQVARTWDEVAAQLAAVLSDPDERSRRAARADALSARVHAYRDGGSAARVYRAIQAGRSRGTGDT